MTVSLKPFFSAWLAFLLPVAALGQTVSSPVVGFSSQTVSSSNDTVLKVGFQRSPVFAGRLTAPPTNLGVGRILELNGSPNAGVDELVDTHYVKVTTGGDEGAVYPITKNRGSEVTISTGSAAVQLSSGDGIKIIPWWTLDSFIPPEDQPAERKAQGNLPPDRRLELYLFSDFEGTGFSPSQVFFLTDEGW